MSIEKIFAVTILIFDKLGRIATVSRKHDDNNINLPGGKIDLGETPKDAIIRETFEETGFLVDGNPIEEVFRMVDCDDHLCVTFLYKGSIDSELIKEGKPEGEGYVRWSKFDDICAETSTYKDFNLKLKSVLLDKNLLQ